MTIEKNEANKRLIEKINQVVEEALTEADVTLEDLDAVGVTYGPGLVGALLVGVAEAKAISYAKKLPLIGVHHIEGHVSANYIEHPDLPLHNDGCFQRHRTGHQAGSCHDYTLWHE